jgi:hypothetical protein
MRLKITLTIFTVAISTVFVKAQWGLSGNSISSGQFLGTTNNEQFEIRRNNEHIFSVSGGSAYTIGWKSSSSYSFGQYSFAIGDFRTGGGNWDSEKSYSIGNSAGNAYSFRSFIIGNDGLSYGSSEAFALGNNLSFEDDGGYNPAVKSFAIGNDITLEGTKRFAIGSGISGNSLSNPVDNSFVMGFNSNIPTFFVGTSSGANTTGKVGIATTTPTEKLDVNGAIRLGTTSTTNAGTLRYTGSDFEGYVGGQWKSLTATSVNSSNYFSGNVGIGTATPNEKLEVNGNIKFGSEYAGLLWPQSLTYSGGIVGDDNFGKRLTLFHGNAIVFETGTNVPDYNHTKMIIAPSGNIGMGTNSPSEKLDVNGAIRLGTTTASNAGTLRYTGSDFEGYVGGEWKSLTATGGAGSFSGNMSGAPLYFLGGPADPYYLIQSGAWDYGMEYKHYGGHRFFTNGNYERMVIHRNGNVGIGTSDPTSALEVFGDIKAVRSSSEGGSLNISNPSKTGADQAKEWSIYNMTGSYGNSLQFWGYNSAGAAVGAGDWTNKFTLKDNGNVGVGINNPVEKLEVTGGIKLGTTTAANAGTLRYTGSDFEGYVGGQWKSLTAAGSDGQITISNYNKSGSGVAQRWSLYNMTGSYGNSLQFWAYDQTGCVTGGMCTNRFTIMDNGNVGIGVTTPINKLQIGSHSSGYAGNDLVISNNNGSLAIHNDNTETYMITNERSIAIGANGVKALFIKADGSLGIGTKSPVAKLQVAGGDIVVGNETLGQRWLINSRSAQQSDNFIIAPDDASGAWDYTKQLGIQRSSGKVFIGDVSSSKLITTNAYRLYVKDGIITEKVKVALYSTASWADYVFEEDYKLLSLTEVASFIKENKHLPGVPSAEEVVKNGIEMAEMDATLLKKIEELTLYLVEQNERLDALEKENKRLKSEQR